MEGALSQNRGLSAAALKYLACALMLIDHLGVILFPQVAVLRLIGRLAFPIFAFMIANGYLHSKNRGRYLLRLVLFAVAFQWFFAHILDTTTINIFATLALGLAAIWLADIIKKQLPSSWLGLTLGAASCLAICVIAQLINVDYGGYGVALIYLAWLFFDRFPLLALSWGLLNILAVLLPAGQFSMLQVFSLLALLPIYFYNGAPGKSNRWFFYVFYCGHLIILYLLKLWLF